MAALEEIEPFSVTVKDDQGELVVVTLAGELDLSTAPQLVAALEQVPTDGQACLDMSACTFIDSTGLQVIVSSARQFRRDGGELSVTRLEGDVAALFRISGLLLEGSALAYRDSA